MTLAVLLCLPGPWPSRGLARAQGGDFWSDWGDGKAEVSGYRLTQPRYGQPRDGMAVLIFVTEDFSDSARVKADPGKHPPSDVYPVMKLNFIRKFQTGIYDYSVMTSVFSRPDWPAGQRPWPLRKISFSSQEWCGQVYHQLLPHGPPGLGSSAASKLASTSHSYFDGEGDAGRDLDFPAGGVSEDELPILLRSYAGRADFLAPGASVTVPFLPSLLRVRLLHKPLAWGSATITRAAAPDTLATPTGQVPVSSRFASDDRGASRFASDDRGASRFAITYTVTARGDGMDESGTFQYEAAAPHKLLGWRWDSGDAGQLVGSARLSYWKLNGPGGESYLKELGLAPESRLAGSKAGTPVHATPQQ